MEINQIKSSLSILTVLKHYNHTPNRNNMLLCPFHKEKEPSLKIYPKTNSFNCFGCGAGGDVIEFIQLKEKADKRTAILKAKSMIQGSIADPAVPTQIKTKTKPVTRKPVNLEIVEKIFKQFQSGLRSNLATKPKAYLKQRNLKPEILEIGYNSGQFHHRGKLSEKDFRACIEAGLLIEYKGYTPNGNKTNHPGGQAYTPFAKECIIFPLKDEKGRIVSIYGRSITEGKGSHYYLKNRTGLYPGYLNPDTKKLILTEAIIDAATLLQLPGITKEYAVLSLYGTNGLTPEHRIAIEQLQDLQEIILFFDGDRAGKQAIEKYARELSSIQETIAISSVTTPGGEDINSLHQLYDNENYFVELLSKRTTLFSLTENFLSEDIERQENGLADQSGEKSETNSKTSIRLNTKDPDRLIYNTEDLRITIWGGIEKENLSRLKVSLHIKTLAGDDQETDYSQRSFRDDVNLYSHIGTRKLIQSISESLELSTSKVNTVITDLTEQLEAYRLEQRFAMAKSLEPKRYEMTPEEKQEALVFLKSENSGKKTLELIQQSGLVGEEKNGLLLFFLYLSRLMDEPLHAIIFGKSGSGKTYLQTKVSECLPPESVRTITSLTENTLYYSAKDFWKHKVLMIEDLEGVYNAFLPLREFMSKQSITKLTTDKDVKGNNIQKLLTVEGPVCVSGATTKGYIYEDNANRSFLLHIDESSSHLNQVMDYQRKLQAGMINESYQQKAKQLLQNTQRLLKKVKVINPYAIDLKIPDCVFKKLRTNMHYLKLIEIITFYNQQQRKWKKSQSGEYYIESTLEDIELANWLVKETLLRKSDELSSDLRSFFESLKQYVQGEEGEKHAAESPAKERTAKNFFAKDIRKAFRMHPMKLSRYLGQLEQRNLIKRLGSSHSGHEYIIQSFEDYELLKEGVNILDKILEKAKAGNNGSRNSKDITERGNKELHKGFTAASQNQLKGQTINN